MLKCRTIVGTYVIDLYAIVMFIYYIDILYIFIFYSGNRHRQMIATAITSKCRKHILKTKKFHYRLIYNISYLHLQIYNKTQRSVNIAVQAKRKLSSDTF